MSQKKVMCKIKKKLNTLVADKKFIKLENNFYNEKNLYNFTQFINYYNSYIKKTFITFKYNYYYTLDISFTDSLGKILFKNNILFSLNNIFNNKFDNLSIDDISNLFNKYNDDDNNKFETNLENNIVSSVLLKKKKNKWTKQKINEKYFYSCYTPDSVNVSYSTSSIDSLYTNSINLTGLTLTGDENSLIISICGGGGNGLAPECPTSIGSGGSGSYCRITIFYKFIYTYTTYTISSINVNINYMSPILTITYKDNVNNKFDLLIYTYGGTDAIETTGKGGQIPIVNYIFYNLNDISTKYFIAVAADLVVGNDGGEPNKNGTYNYTSSGSGVNTRNSSNDNYPYGLSGNPTSSNKMTLPGSSYEINSQGGGYNQISSGFGSGGGAAPVSWAEAGAGNAGEIRRGRPAFVQIMSTCCTVKTLFDQVYTKSTILSNEVLYTDFNALIISTCSSGGKGSTPKQNPKATGSGGSGGYIKIIIYYNIVYNNSVYIVNNIDLNFNNGNTTTTVTYMDNTINKYKFELIIYTYCATSGTTGMTNSDGTTGRGGILPVFKFNFYDLAEIPTDTIIYTYLSFPGQDGGEPDKNGTSNYTSSGSGVNTTGYVNGQYSYPNGLAGNPPLDNSMTLPGSLNTITSQGGGNTNISSGYGSGGGASPSNWKIGNTNQEVLIEAAGKAFVQIMSTMV